MRAWRQERERSHSEEGREREYYGEEDKVRKLQQQHIKKTMKSR